MPTVLEARSSSAGSKMARGILEAPRDASTVENDDNINPQARYQAIKPTSSLAVKDAAQLPSPSPSPSPESSSPSLGLAETSTDWATSLSSIHNGSHYSASFEKSPGTISTNENTNMASLSSPLPISKSLSPSQLHDIPEEKPRNRRKISIVKPDERVLRLSPAEMQELTSSPDSLPVISPMRPLLSARHSLAPSPSLDMSGFASDSAQSQPEEHSRPIKFRQSSYAAPRVLVHPEANGNHAAKSENPLGRRPGVSSRAISSPTAPANRMSSYTKASLGPGSPKRSPLSTSGHPEPLNLVDLPPAALPNGGARPSLDPPSPVPQAIPLPPMSIPTYLQLELSSSRPSPLYIYRSASSDRVYESSKIKFDRLLNFLLLPPQLEQVLYFGSLACLDAWLYTFTILPLRFLKAAAILVSWWCSVLVREVKYITGFVYHGSGRMLERQRGRSGSIDSTSRSRSVSRARRPAPSTAPSFQSNVGAATKPVNSIKSAANGKLETSRKSRHGWGQKHKRSKSEPSSLSRNHKADLLQGAVIVCSCIILMKLDASRMYHNIKGQAAIKLYVIYNIFEVFDRLLSALGQDIFECLSSDETLERDADGRSRVIRPMGMFFLALIYNVIHAAALFYQVIALNVAVNSYSNALLTLLLSNQFVEIKSTVFKKFEKDNLFQLTCADIVERFQLWLMLTIIVMRNIVEMGGLRVMSSAFRDDAEYIKDTTAPIRSMMPNSFTILPSWAGEVLSPFLLVLGIEMLVDWIKHAYISKFNCVKPAVYQRYLDVLAKDYYTNAFVDQNLIKRLGLPVIPLSCLFIRSSVQTYHMFLATHFPPPVPSATTAISVESATSSPTAAALEHFDNIIRRALGRSAFGVPNPAATGPWYLPGQDEIIATITMLIFFLGAFLVLLACKLVLGMLLLRYARNRYGSMKQREHIGYSTAGKRVGGWGMVEVDDDKRRWIHDDDMETLRKRKEKEKAAREAEERGGSWQDFGKVSRYEMSAKRIW